MWRQRVQSYMLPNNLRQAKLKIEGYTDQLSVEPGDEIGFHVSTNARTYSMTIARVGIAREVVWSRDGLPGKQSPVPEDAFSHGCHWPVALSLTVPADWKSGYYQVVLEGSYENDESARGEMFFVVRTADLGRRARILLVLTTNTYNAYNTWGGASFYHGPGGPGRRLSFDRPFEGFKGAEGLYKFSIPADFENVVESLSNGLLSEGLAVEAAKHGISLSPKGSVTVEQPGRTWRIIDVFGIGGCYRVELEEEQVSFYNRSVGWLSGWHTWERNFVSWAEKNGYEMDYAASSDLEFRSGILEHYPLVLSVGHDEYWSSPMRDHLEGFIAAGGNVAFLSGNVAYWQVRSEDRGRALVCWKDEYPQDPVYNSGPRALLSTMWCHRLIGRPENQLTGVSFAYGGYHRFFDQFHDAAHAYTVHRPDHWLFEGTGLKQGDLLGAADGIVNYECDGCAFETVDGVPVPTHEDGTPSTFEILGSAPAGLTTADRSLPNVAEALYGQPEQHHPQPGLAVLGSYRSGGTVVTSGCTDWVKGLTGRDPVVERITVNILDRLSSS